MEDKIKLVLHNVQQNVSCHQKYLKVLKNYYNKIPNEDFLRIFFQQLKLIFHMDILVKNPYVERTLDYLAQFVCALIKPNENDSELSVEEDSPSHPFLTQIIYETLKYHDLDYVQTRYYSCRFITLILKYIGYETHLDSNICDSIQEAMLERTLDPKASIRLQAVMALVRLQEPLNPDCPVITAYQSLLTDANPMIRKEVVKMIAPNVSTRPKISERINDVDYHVRIAAYKRCADIGPMLFKIIIRQQILKCGFHETNNQVKNVFLENLLPKWLTAYNGNFLAFLSGLKLDADENDILNTEEISKQVMEAFFKSHPIKDIINYLPLDNSKLIPINNLSSEVITYWSIVTNFLRSSDETEEYLEDIIPELTPFCNYIQNIINFKTSKKMQDWEYLDFQYILYNLFNIAEQYDLSDEVGRRTFHKLVMSTLHQKIQFKLAKKMVVIADKLISNVDILSNEICQIISDIREPLVDKPTIQNENTDRNFQMAELKVKVNILQGEIEDALDNQDFQKASEIQNELMEHKRKLEDLNKPTQVVKVRVSKDDPETLCRCLDLLTALLLLPHVKILSPSLETCKSEFLLPLLTSNVVEINWRVLKCLTLYSFLDKSIAEEHLKVLCIPIATYRAIPNYNKFAVIVSVSAVCDLMHFYGAEIFSSEEDTNNTTSTHNTTRRRLYRNERIDDVTIVDHNRMNVECIIEIILDMLDDENEEIRETAVTGITKLILTDFLVNPLLMSRIILKWFNPLTGIADASCSSRAVKLRTLDNEKSTDKVQQKLGFLISNYTKVIKGAREVIEQAVIPTLTSIANAPRSSPLADIDIDNVLRFLAAITDSSDTMDIVNIHANLAQSLCFKIASKPLDAVAPYLSKMLLYLEIPPDSASINELITQAQLLLEEEEDSLFKGLRKNIIKFVEKLKALQNHFEHLEVIVENTENSVEQTENNTRDDREIDNEYSNSELQNHCINAQIDNTCEVQIEKEKQFTEKNKTTSNSDKTVDTDNRTEPENIMKKRKNLTKKDTDNCDNDTEVNEKILKRRGVNGYKNGRKNKKIVENSTSDTDCGSVVENRRSKRKKKRTDKEEVSNKQKNTSISNTSVNNSNSSEKDSNSTVEQTPFESRQQRIGLKNTNLHTRSMEGKTLCNRDQHLTGTVLNTNMDQQKQKSQLNNKKRNFLKGTREETNKLLYVTKKNNRTKANDLIKKHEGRKHKNNLHSDHTRGLQVERDNMTLRRSKRPQSNMDRSETSIKSSGSETENSKNIVYQRVPLLHVDNNLCDIQTRKSSEHRSSHTSIDLSIHNRQPIAESTRNHLQRTLRNSTMNATNERNSKININGVKRRKSRGKKSQDLDGTGDTILHTIIEKSLQVKIINDMTIHAPTSKNSYSKININGVKRRKSRGKKSQDLDGTGDTILHTIIEKSLQVKIINDMTIHAPTSKNSSPNSLQLSHSQNSSGRNRVIISETSSDSESASSTSSMTRSTRKIKKKNMDSYIL